MNKMSRVTLHHQKHKESTLHSRSLIPSAPLDMEHQHQWWRSHTVQVRERTPEGVAVCLRSQVAVRGPPDRAGPLECQQVGLVLLMKASHPAGNVSSDSAFKKT